MELKRKKTFKITLRKFKATEKIKMFQQYTIWQFIFNFCVNTRIFQIYYNAQVFKNSLDIINK